MSLDVYLYYESETTPKGSGIFVRKNGRMMEITREEWDEKFPGREPMMVVEEDDRNEVYWANITHNLNKMAEKAGVYKAMWRPEELGITHAHQLIPILEAGLESLEVHPEMYTPLNPSNGWGDYDGLVDFVREYLDACRKFPDTKVSASR